MKYSKILLMKKFSLIWEMYLHIVRTFSRYLERIKFVLEFIMINENSVTLLAFTQFLCIDFKKSNEIFLLEK